MESRFKTALLVEVAKIQHEYYINRLNNILLNDDEYADIVIRRGVFKLSSDDTKAWTYYDPSSSGKELVFHTNMLIRLDGVCYYATIAYETVVWDTTFK